jgi:hypothetical protein
MDYGVPGYTNPIGVTLRIVRRGAMVELYTKEDGSDRFERVSLKDSTGTEVRAGLSTPVAYVGLALSGGAACNWCEPQFNIITVRYDGIELVQEAGTAAGHAAARHVGRRGPRRAAILCVNGARPAGTTTAWGISGRMLSPSAALRPGGRSAAVVWDWTR